MKPKSRLSKIQPVWEIEISLNELSNCLKFGTLIEIYF